MFSQQMAQALLAYITLSPWNRNFI